MPIVIDEVLITVEVDNAGTAGAAAGGPSSGQMAAGSAAHHGSDKQALVAECVERVLAVLAERREPLMAAPAASSGRLEKLTILAYEAADYGGSPLPERFEAFVNPAEITLGYEVEYDSAQGAGTTGSRQEFKAMKPGDLTLALFIDGTGASGRSADVQAEVARFQTVTGYNGNIHRPNYLKVTWGTLQIKRCVLKSAQIAYKLFRPDGVPLRAVINASFADNADDATRVAMAQDQSPDLTHVRVLRAGDSLPLMCHAIYGDAARCVQVAQANGLDHFRDLPAGTTVVFPPLER